MQIVWRYWTTKIKVTVGRVIASFFVPAVLSIGTEERRCDPASSLHLWNEMPIEEPRYLGHGLDASMHSGTTTTVPDGSGGTRRKKRNWMCENASNTCSCASTPLRRNLRWLNAARLRNRSRVPVMMIDGWKPVRSPSSGESSGLSSGTSGVA